MTSLFHFEDKVHYRNLTRAEAIPLLFPRLLCQILEHLGFPEEPRLERRRAFQNILSINRWPRLPRTHHLSPHDGAERIAVSHLAEDTEHPHIASSAVPITTTESPASPAPSKGPSTSAAPPQHISISAQNFLISLA